MVYEFIDFPGACRASNYGLINTFISKAYFRFNTYEHVIAACSNGGIDVVRHVIEYCKINNIEFDINRVFRVAVCKCELEVIYYLLRQGVDINYREGLFFRETCRNHRLDVMKILVENGADVQASNNVALRDAVLYCDIDIICFLIENGVDGSDVPQTIFDNGIC